ncbi:MAG: REP-associated tyrosine transposase [Chryseotalea sp.]|jgi:putative transposase|nr:transposase [Flammeovirgaceae bacterium]
MHNGIEFFTATCLNWQPLLKADERKDILMNSLRFMVEEKRIWLYAFVIMPNHIHLLWSKQEAWKDKNTSHMFLKFTAQQIKFNLIDNGQNEELQNYKSTQQDRAYHFWERRPFVATMFNKKVAEQKIDYIHENPVKADLCKLPEHYYYSSARFYELNVDDWGFLTHYAEHM